MEFTNDILKSIASITCPTKTGSHEDITHITTLVSDYIAKAWKTHAISSWTSVQSKGWWDKSCIKAMRQYQKSDCSSEEWQNLRRTTKNVKRKYFDEKIKHISSQNKRSWVLMSWVRAPKPDSSEAIVFKGEPCLTTEDTWNAFQETFNSAQS